MTPEQQKTVAFGEVAIVAPGLRMIFKATPARVKRVTEFLLKEANESVKEFQQSLKPSPPNAELLEQGIK